MCIINTDKHALYRQTWKYQSIPSYICIVYEFPMSYTHIDTYDIPK